MNSVVVFRGHIVAGLDRVFTVSPGDSADSLRKLDATSVRLAGRSFADLPFDRQTRVLGAIEASQVPTGMWRGSSG